MSTTGFSDHSDTTHDPSGTESADAKDQARQAAGTAKDGGQRVAGVAKDEAKQVTDEATTQVRGLLDDASSQLDEQSKAQKAKLAETVRSFGQDLDSMTSQGESSEGLAGQVVQQVADQARTLAGHLEDREPRELLEDVRSFARRRPGTFLLGALAAGVVVGRLTRGAKAAKDDFAPSSPSRSAPQPVTVGTPLSDRTDEVAATVDSGLDESLAPQTDLGAKGIEMSRSGVAGPTGGRV